MKIAVNCWILRNKKIDGIGIFTIETLRLLISAHPETKFQILCDKNFTEDYFDFPNSKKYHIFPPYRHPLLYLFFMEIVVGVFLKKHKPDLFLSMEGFLCLSTKCKQLPIIYDLNFEHQPKDLPFRNRIYFRTFYPKFARTATRIVTISEYSKNDIADTYKIPLNKIDNVSCGVKENFYPLDDNSKQITRNRYTKGAEYFFFIGSMHPRKNIVRLLQAFELFKKKSNAPLKLVLAGNIFWGDESVQAVISTMNAKDDIVFTGRISDDELENLLGSAFALTFVPTFEGFGLPIVEAFQSDVPVICSSTTSMPEVAGNAALMVDPFNTEDIAEKMKLLWNDKLLVQELIDKGRLQKNLFTWKRTAELLYKSIENCLKL
jgi:glycosyltransferase involved in cell wall biosynthesis